MSIGTELQGILEDTPGLDTASQALAGIQEAGSAIANAVAFVEKPPVAAAIGAVAGLLTIGLVKLAFGGKAAVPVIVNLAGKGA